MSRHINLKCIRPQGGDHRGAFEELSFQLFSRELAGRDISVRRHGAGGDGGLEGFIADVDGHVLIGLQAKFFDDKLGTTQWRDLDLSIRTAIRENAASHTLREVVITLPRNFTQQQTDKWSALKLSWASFVTDCGYEHRISFTLWNESFIRSLLLSPSHRGLLLHYFEYPNFDRAQCSRKTEAAIRALGDRYRPEMHTETDAEDAIHTFLRSERFRIQYLEEARERLGKGLGGREASPEWSDELRQHYEAVVAAKARMRTLLGDGVSLPRSLSELADALDVVSRAFTPLLEGLRALIPPRKPRDDREMWQSYAHQKHPSEEVFESFAGNASALGSLSSFLREHSASDSQVLLMSGEPGRGKTHVLAEVCTRYSEQGGAVLFMEGGIFQSGISLWEQVMRWADFPGTSLRDFLATFASLSEGTGLKSLICVDALNEISDRDLWRNGLLLFASELREYPEIKLIVSCREDYMRQTLPNEVVMRSLPAWSFTTHEGLGVDVLEALPKYLKAYDVRGFALPPLAREFKVPLFLRIFCEAYSGQTPDAGTLSLTVILSHFASRKASIISGRIDCEIAQVLGALKDIGGAMLASKNLRIPDDEARRICLKHYNAPSASRSLYRALLSECILAEVPESQGNIFGNRQSVRFTYERVWDYFLSVHLLAEGASPADDLMKNLRSWEWRRRNCGVINLLGIRIAEEQQIELFDLISSTVDPEPDLLRSFMESMPWRTKTSMTQRARELFVQVSKSGYLRNDFDHLVSYATNPAHPWNASWLHQALLAVPLAKRDREWTFWVNESLSGWTDSNPLEEIRAWAERGDLKRVPEDQLLLLATVIAWCLSTTVVEQRLRLAATLTRVVAVRTSVAAKLLEQFVAVDDPYIKERVLLACAGAAQHASVGDKGLDALSQIAYREFFAGSVIEPHLLVRHYASEICIQAEEKGMLGKDIPPASFRPPWRSKWPKIWSAKKVTEQKEALGNESRDHHASCLYYSVEPGPGIGYGDWGRYIMEGYVHQFQNKRLSGKASKSKASCFDAQIAKRFVIQRVFQLGWDCTKTDIHPESAGESSERRVERLSKKYQWIALYELLGYLSDHYHFAGWGDVAQPFRSARQIQPRDLLDPFIVDHRRERSDETWMFVKAPSPWWRGHLDPLPKPLCANEQRWLAKRIENDDPRILLELCDGKDEWLTLSAFHQWDEPTPIWEHRFMVNRLGMEWAIQSYLVSPDLAWRLVDHLSHRCIDQGQLWIHEPEFGQSMASLKVFPKSQDSLEKRCCLDNWRESRYWRTGAISTTCRCAPDEERRRAKDGSMPSPQLARIGNLVWTGHGFDFAEPGSTEVLVRHLGEGFHGACLVRKDALIKWLSTSGLCIIWRCYGFKFRRNEHDECNAREYWMTYAMDKGGQLMFRKGGTSACPSSVHDEEILPWDDGRLGKESLKAFK